MTAPRDVSVEWADGVVPAILQGPDGGVGILLAHGAGAGQHHRWMEAMRDLLSTRLPTMTFDYRYTAAGRRSPDRMPTLLAVHRAAADLLAGVCGSVVLAGKSMGGRVGSHLAGDEGWPAAGLVYYGYPLVPLGRGEPRDTSHLDAITAPQLFFAGTRDRLGPPPLVEPIARRVPSGTLVTIPDADHSFAVTKQSGRTQHQVLAEIAAETMEWVDRYIGST